MTLDDGSASDELLASQAQRGDRSAFETLVQRHKVSLYRWMRRYVGQTDDAYDVLQDTFIAAWEALHRYDLNRPFLPWLRTIALNKCRDFSRRRTFRRWLSRAYAVESVATASLTDLEHEETQTAIDNERLRRLDAAIANLPPTYKEPLLLTTVGRLTQEEAAAVLHTTTKAIEMRLRRARRKLADALGEPTSEG